MDVKCYFRTCQRRRQPERHSPEKSVEPVVDSMSRNPDACIWLARLKQHDQYAYQHSLSASIWASGPGPAAGPARHDLRSLAMGCMLMDVQTAG
jgi:HD-GYP domain-containing protein (c-di-GMP phosphodiesterase class II)